MNNDAHACYIIQKHTLAAALAVLKCKPHDISIEDHIRDMRNGLLLNSIDIEDIDLTICSDDFNFDDRTIISLDDDVRVDNDDLIENDVRLDNAVETQISNDDATAVLQSHSEQLFHNANVNNVNLTKTASLDSQKTLFSTEGRTKTCNEYNVQKISAKPNKEPKLDSQTTELYDVSNLIFSQNYTHVSQTQGESTNRVAISVGLINGSETNKNNFNRIGVVGNGIDRNENFESCTFFEYPSTECPENIANVPSIDTGKEWISNTDKGLQDRGEEMLEDRRMLKITNEYLKALETTDPDVEGGKNAEVESEMLVPFKVIEAMNCIKSLVRKHERIVTQDGPSQSTDSGYKTDSQHRIFLSRQSECCMNEKATMLFKYLLSGHSSKATHALAQDISQVMGEYIDKLHSEEACPPFLDHAMEAIDNLLQDVLKGDSCGQIMITIEKNEAITKLLLLNRSSPVISYTIDKIVNKLKVFHASLKSPEILPEISDIGQMENLCHIFHILETLLIRLAKKRKCENSSQTNSMSQNLEGRSLPKRSSIADVWRRKWDPNYKEVDKGMEAKGRMCDMAMCGDVLKNIIVDCMESYGLISFAALQCFNRLQDK